MSNIIRKLSLFLVPLIFLELCSCGLVVINYDKFSEGTGIPGDKDGAPNGTGTVTEAPVTLDVVENDHTDTIKANLAKVPERDYNGAVFKITSPDTSSVDGEGELEFLSEAASKRNGYVSEKHNISIVSSKVDYNEYYSEVNAAVKSGMYYSDLLMIPQEMVSSFAAANLILNMRSMPGLDFDADYFNSTSVGAAAGGFDSFAIAGPASIYPYSLPAVFFNKDLAVQTDIDPYNLVSSGTWTWDRFFEICVGAAADENYFSWGTTNMDEAVYETAFVACGNNMINSGIMEVPSLAFDAETSAPAVEILRKMYTAEKTIKVNSASMAYFNEGNGFFQLEKLSAMTDLRGSKVSWGILPFPKADASAEYKTLAGKDSLMFACPSTVSTPEKSAIMLMSLNAASDGIIKDAYIEYIQYNFLRDNESANMLDYIFDGIVYDFAYTFGDRHAAVANGTYNMIRLSANPDENMTSLINGRKASLDRTLAISFGLSN